MYLYICIFIANSLYKDKKMTYSQFVELILTSVTNGLNFVDIIVVNNVIKCGVELVEEVDHLVRGASTRQLREAYNVTVRGKMQLIRFKRAKQSESQQSF